MPGFDVMDYGQEDYVFGDTETDARHWDKYVLQALQEHSDVLEPLFNASASEDADTSTSSSTEAQTQSEAEN